MKGEYLLKNLNDTEALGLKLAAELEPGDVLALTGDLGAGKTTLTRSIARGLGVKGAISSPTFTIVHEYDDGRLPLYHFDVYRVSDSDELFELGFEDYLDGKGVCVIEWADLLEEGLLPERTINIRLGYGSAEDERICTIC